MVPRPGGQRPLRAGDLPLSGRRALARSLTTDLTAADFTVDALTRLWGGAADTALHRGHRVLAVRALRERHPLSTLAAAFVLGLPVSRLDLDLAVPLTGSAGLAELGIVEQRDGLVHPLLDLRPYSFVDSMGVGSWWIASDLGEASTGGELREDHVLGVGGASLTLSSLMIPSPVLSALDLGTGCGIQALHASRVARRVVATDISERALVIAELNAELNGVTNIEFRAGSLFDPVGDESFDLIVSNPPFVITPRSGGIPQYEYRDGGMGGDDLVAEVVRGCLAHLNPGGIAQLLGNWEYHAGAAGPDRALGWAAAPGVDAWIIERERQDVAAYAETWIRDGGTRPGHRFDQLYAAWLDDFAARGVTEVGFGYVTLRRGTAGADSAAPLRRTEVLATALGHNTAGVGEHLAACLRAHDWLAATPDLGAARLTLAADVTEERHYWPGAEHPTVMTLRQGSGFGRSAPLDTALAGFVGACDGELDVDSIIGALADLLDADVAALRSQLTPRVRELVLTGFLRP